MGQRLGVATPLFLPKMDGDAMARLQNQLSRCDVSNNLSQVPSNVPYTVLSARDNNNRSSNESQNFITRQLIDGLRGGNGDNADAEDNFKNFNDEDESNDYVNVEYPEGFGHLLQLLWTKNEKKMFSLSNPDGYFYLFYLKTLLKFFSVNLIISGVTMSLVCY